MADVLREKGGVSYSGNFETHKAGPLDARRWTPSQASLLLEENWTGNDGGVYLHKGFYTVVYNDPNPANDGMYILKTEPVVEGVNTYETLSNWARLAMGSDTITSYMDLLNKPSINGITLNGDVSLTDLGIDPFLKPLVVNELPAEGQLNTVYIVSTTGAEWLWTENPDTPGVYEWNSLGILGVDLSGYYNREDIDALIAAINTNIETNSTDIAGLTTRVETNEADITALETGSKMDSNLETTVSVGGINAGEDIGEMGLKALLVKMLVKELFPEFTNPKLTGSLNGSPVVEVGTAVSPTFSVSFTRGTINPAYETSGFRSGLPISYTYSGTGIVTPVVQESTLLSDTYTIPEYTFTSNSTARWGALVNYSAGEQPLSNFGHNYSTALAAGDDEIFDSISAVYPYYATTADLTLSKQPIAAFSGMYELTLTQESNTEKQAFQFASALGNITRIEVFNTNNNQWETSTTHGFVEGDRLTKTIDTGIEVEFRSYTHAGSKIGERQVRLYIG